MSHIPGDLADASVICSSDGIELEVKLFRARAECGAELQTLAVARGGLAVSWTTKIHAGPIIEPLLLTVHSALLPTRWTEVRNEDPCRLIGIPCFQHDDPIGALCPPTGDPWQAARFLGRYWHYKNAVLEQRKAVV